MNESVITEWHGTVSIHFVTQRMRCFLDFDIDGHRARYARARAFVKHAGTRYGFTSDAIEKLGGSERARVRACYESDFEWRGKGEIEIAPASNERVVIELYDDCPLAKENFAALCAGDRGIGKASSARLHYKGSVAHRCVKNFMIQLGDFTHGNGAGGESVFGRKFKDDLRGLKRKHDGAGTVSMSNTGKNTNSSQFFIALGAAKHLDGKHVVFGRVVEGMELIQKINDELAVEPGSVDERPLKAIVIADCGVLE